MGTVWLAHDQSLDRVCALKIVDPDKASSEEVRKRFLREARATAQIRSVHVVEVFEHGVWDGLPFIVMELLDGEDLGARLDRLGAFEPEAAYRIVAQIARGLGRAHALGIVHRDLKPENVFLVPRDGEEIAKVLDFGIAHHAIYSPLDKATQAGAVMGTPCYMSPEQALGEPIDWRADLWALGVLAFQCLTGKLPFWHEAIGGLLTQILYEPLPSIREANPALPKAIEDFWHRAAERDPGKRFQKRGGAQRRPCCRARREGAARGSGARAVLGGAQRRSGRLRGCVGQCRRVCGASAQRCAGRDGRADYR